VTQLTAAPGYIMSSLDIVPREESERRLAAILVADVVGYSRLMQADEESTLSRLEEIGASIIERRVAAHRGHIFKTMGDGLLIEFPSVVEAVLCAAEIQEELRLRDADPPEQRIQLRIGINIGDVIRKGNDVFGTGVNIAARLESLAEPGSIYISGEAYDQVRDRPFAFDDLGMKAVKNIARLVRVYRVRPGEVTRTSARAAQWFPQSWRLRAAAAGSLIGLAIVVAAIVLLLPATLKKTISSDTQRIPATETPLGSDKMSAWAKIKSSDKIDELASYLDQFPNSRYSEYIRHRLNALRSHPEMTKFRDCIDCPEMVVIPPGSFTMGIPQTEIDRYGFSLGDPAPLHLVRIARPFALGEFLVTRKQYAIFAEETGHQGSGCSVLPLDGTSRKFDPALSWSDPGFAQADDHPVVCISWDDAVAYVSWLSKKTGRSYRLTTESEWEYAARAGSTTGRYFGSAPICEFANVRDQSKKLLYSAGEFSECDGGFPHTSPVGSFPSNGFSLYDMLGNAWEWVEDCWDKSYIDAPVDGAARERAFCDGRVRRGASWNSEHRYYYNVGSRERTHPYVRAEIFGFRVASDYPAPGAPQPLGWDGTWAGWSGGRTATKIVISGGNVVEYDYNGNAQTNLGQTLISGDTLTFAIPPEVVITLTKRSPTAATAHFDGPRGKADGELVRATSPGAPQSAGWDGTWAGRWEQTATKIVVSGGNVVEYDYNGNAQTNPGQTIIFENTLTFGRPPGFLITLTKRGPATAAAHYHGPGGEVDGELVRQ
jgi:formylglycine-generating enzyme required for sulfatase activity/class 3 adenylate cyclase